MVISMKGITSWSFRPYTEMIRPARGEKPYICRLAPFDDGFTVEFIDNGAPLARHTVCVRVRGEGDFTAYRPEENVNLHYFKLDRLVPQTDYEVYVERDDGERSSVRLVRTGYVPGTVINYLHPDDEEYAFSGHYLCSPSVIRTKSGRLLASMDVFAGNFPQNLTLIYSSDDDGATWHYLTELFPCFWGKMFYCKEKLYMLGCSREYGDLLIGRSDDDGAHWTTPTVLFRGSNVSNDLGLHRAPMPVLIENGRIMTDVQYGAWAKKLFYDIVLSAPEDADLLDASVWSASEGWSPLEHPGDGLPGIAGGIEGCIVKAPDGRIYDMLRYAYGKWLKLEYRPDRPDGPLAFAGLVDFPSTASKCDILYDEKSRLYWSLVSCNLPEPHTNRNLLTLICSPDLDHWETLCPIIDYRDADPKFVAFQYIDFFFEGDDILFTSRTAFNGAKNFHDNNYQTFHRIENFRSLKK